MAIARAPDATAECPIANDLSPTAEATTPNAIEPSPVITDSRPIDKLPFPEASERLPMTTLLLLVDLDWEPITTDANWLAPFISFYKTHRNLLGQKKRGKINDFAPL